jgi:hypothetical protein
LVIKLGQKFSKRSFGCRHYQAELGSELNNRYISQINSPANARELQYELNKCQLIIEQQTKEIDYLKQQIGDLREINNLLKGKEG